VPEEPSGELITLEAVGEVVVLRFDRPPANALDLALLERMLDVLEELRSGEPGAVVITGTGSFFSGGLDIKALPALDEDGQREMVNGINRMFAEWYGFPRPVVCAVNGHAVAGGMVLVLVGDRRIGPDEATFGLTEVRVGVPYPATAIELVRAELTPAAARRLALAGGLMDARAAAELGVIDEVVPAADVRERALDVAADLATIPGHSFALTKEALRGDSLERMRRAAGGVDPVVHAWLADLNA
jgi:enoyl-CoA hydratase/carnithine racemase